MELSPSSYVVEPVASLPASESQMPATRARCGVWILAAALVSLAAKLAIAFNTFGTNDVATFYIFARTLNDHGLEWTYRNGAVFFSNFPVFNHPPLTAYYLQLIEPLSRLEFFRSSGLTFPFLLRLPGIISDFVVVLVLVRLSQSNPQLQTPNWALALFALSPVSLMVSGFHGNTDPVLVMFLVLAVTMCLCGRPVPCGILFALSCQVKVISLLVLPIIFFFWLARRAAIRFSIPFVILCLAMWAEPLLKFPTLFAKNVFAYGSFWGEWGITYWLRLTQWGPLAGTGAFRVPPSVAAIAFLLKVLIVATVLMLAWRRRYLPTRGVIDSIALAWVFFFVFSPGICVQYMVWLAPFVLILSPGFYGWLTATSSLFLFFFYNTIAGGLPWFLGISTNNPEKLDLWTPWSLWPWATLIVGMVLLWKEASLADSSFRLFSLKTACSQSGSR